MLDLIGLAAVLFYVYGATIAYVGSSRRGDSSLKAVGKALTWPAAMWAIIPKP